MPVYTFSTKDNQSEDTKMVNEIKNHCVKHGIVFSKIVIDMLKKYQINSKEINGKNKI